MAALDRVIPSDEPGYQASALAGTERRDHSRNAKPLPSEMKMGMSCLNKRQTVLEVLRDGRSLGGGFTVMRCAPSLSLFGRHRRKGMDTAIWIARRVGNC
ncbi:hypothetical protein LPU83_pLPU83b_0071 (plasmid) [Rhizobium favelukesii]|uniref:Uncharacterized protein n=1 Tax=Rhizobium favelukesii TaxID=348824 RepID=W6S0R5_9HYPH|nr:hypothetical protein LPU83_pLPU83b_0071 [Rhizobium favelukesii]